jgi:hypothetical protein
VQVVADQVAVAAILFEVDQTAVDFGLGTLSIVPDVEITGTLLVFVTEATVTGNLGPTSPEAVQNADAICQSEADAAGLSGTFWAWLSYEVGGIVVPDYAPAYFEFWHPTMSGQRLFRTDGVPFAESWETLLLEGPSAALDVLADGTIANNTYAWTGTNADGTVDVAKGTCSGWTDDSSTTGVVGLVHSLLERWTHYGPGACRAAFSLYCFEELAPAP